MPAHPALSAEQADAMVAYIRSLADTTKAPSTASLPVRGAYTPPPAAGSGDAPHGVVLCYQRSLYDHVLRTEGVEPSRRGLPVALPSTGGRVGLLGRFGIGAPAATAALEELAALGTSAVISVGTAGSLQRDLKPGDLVLCQAAIETLLVQLVLCRRKSNGLLAPVGNPLAGVLLEQERQVSLECSQ